MRWALLATVASLLLVAPARADRWHPTVAWLAQAQCVHRLEGPWNANTGNGYFGGMQVSAATWFSVRGPRDAAFGHPGDPGFPFGVSSQDQLRVAWRVWLRDGRSWRSWGHVGRRCTHAAAA